MKKLIISSLLLLLSTVALAQINLAETRILADTTYKPNREAAVLLQKHIKLITGADVEIFKETKNVRKGDVIIGQKSKLNVDSIGHDGFVVSVDNGKLLVNGKGNGVTNAVGRVLETLGVRYWAEYAVELPESKTLILHENLYISDTPAFEHRQVNGPKGDYLLFHGLRYSDDIFVPGYWVHTFLKFVPVSVYGETNPEYFAEINGKRYPGHGTQLCLTNDDVYRIIEHHVDSLFKANPDKKLLSVSQNDSQFSYCQCPKCKQLDQQEGSLNGAIIHFMNRLAERFPDKEISTLAYNYSVEPPKSVKPRENVNIMLCNIESNRELPLTDISVSFVDAIEKWGEISNNVFMWDYGINFSGLVSPFPNFHVLQPNLQLFHENGVKYMFEQLNGGKGTDFAELRNYMAAKLMWNPYMDVDKLMKDFITGYYKEAAPYIYDYIRLQHGGLIASGKRLWIYDTPASHRDGFLNAPLLREYNRLYDRAEKAVENNKEILDRVRLSRLSLQYAELECSRSSLTKDVVKLEMLARLFDERTKYFGIKMLNERGNSPQDYTKEYIERYLTVEKDNIALGADIQWVNKPSEKYGEKKAQLTDGFFGGSTFNDGWVGWLAEDGELIVDLGSQKEFSSVETDCLQILGSWVFLPRSVSYQTSIDGVNYADYGTVVKEENTSWQVLYVRFGVERKPVTARYIKVKLEGIADCPSWHPGVGHAGWIFTDEIVVK